MSAHPILWSFRRCPYAMRARLALLSAGLRVELREIVLRDKPPAFLAASPSATVPCLQLPGQVIDESLDIMFWALLQHDPEGLLAMPDAGHALIAQTDGPFKSALDRTKYAARYPDCDPRIERARAATFLQDLERQLQGHGYLFGDRPTLADLAILPFVRQFAFIDRAWFETQSWPRLVAWLDAFIGSDAFARIMPKYPRWQEGDPPLWFAA